MWCIKHFLPLVDVVLPLNGGIIVSVKTEVVSTGS